MAAKYEKRLFINGEYVHAQSGDTTSVQNPEDETVVCEGVQLAGAEDVDRAVDAASKAFKSGPWKTFTAAQRADVMNKFADLVLQHATEFLPLEPLAMGAPLHMQRFQLQFMANCFRYYAGWVDKVSGEQFPADDGVFKIVSYEPLGVCAGIGAWNGSYFLFAAKAAPALAAGNTLVYKPSEKSPLGLIALGRLFNEAGFPPGVVNIINGFGSTGALLASHMRIAKISFTGSASTGKKIAKMAADANLKRCTLELGGKNACIVFDDADIQNSAKICSINFLMNTGQVCHSASRVLVHESIADVFLAQLKDRFIAAKNDVGSPFAETTLYGPLADKAQFDRVLSFIEGGKQEAELVVGGSRIGDKGFFIEPTVFLNPNKDAMIWKEEIFGPILCVRTFSTEEEAIKLANESRFGLSASIHTRSISRALRVSRAMESGNVAINQNFRIAIQTPFGGFKESGLGKEFGRDGIMHYLQSKTIMINMNI